MLRPVQHRAISDTTAQRRTTGDWISSPEPTAVGPLFLNQRGDHEPAQREDERNNEDDDFTGSGRFSDAPSNRSAAEAGPRVQVRDMPIMLNTLLGAAGLPLSDVRLLRHKDKRATKGRSPYELWRKRPAAVRAVPSSQSIENRKKLTAPYWAVFIVNLKEETMFGGVSSQVSRVVGARHAHAPH